MESNWLSPFHSSVVVKLLAIISLVFFKRTREIKLQTFSRELNCFLDPTFHIWKQPAGMCLLCEVVSTVDSVLVVQCEWYATHIHVTHLQW